ncbi:MAG: UDP-3-O-(3-hydroxymyristoyl)glucosamine N-acyltransferase [Chlorobi bacterium]|nr:UDP-3-O-(3-hydroxymyristoyl)glucosamine N-acyltransferase [Chlorobiota bacterium]
METITASQLAEIVGGTIEGDPSVFVHRMAKIEEAGPGECTFVANPKYEKYIATTGASVIILSESASCTRDDITIIRARDAYLAFVKSLEFFYTPPQWLTPGVSDTAILAADAFIGEGTWIGEFVVVGKNTRIGKNCRIGHGVIIGPDVTLGDETVLYPNVTVLSGSRIGTRVTIHSGTVIGSDGFGFVPVGERFEKIPQTGIVVIEDDVEIGANCAIDRATLGETVIRKRAKLDNLIQVAHNVEIGSDTVVAGQSGFSGSTKVGQHVIIAGQVGIAGHLEIADHVTIAAQSGVSKSLTQAGKTYWGSPAKEHHQALRLEGAIRQLPELIKKIRELEEKIEALESSGITI